MRRSKRLLAGRVPCRCAEARAGPRYRILRFVETINAVSVITRPAINRIPMVRMYPHPGQVVSDIRPADGKGQN
jgi:hypothetical protein